MRKKRLTSEEVLVAIINKELERHGVDFNYVKDLPYGKINGAWWYDVYQFDSEKERDEWKEFSVNLIAKNLKCSKGMALKKFSMVDISYGLTVKKHD